jgi:hypothetical protein
VTPDQLRWLTSAVAKINSIVERCDFWDRYTAGLEKGRIFALGIETQEVDPNSERVSRELAWYKDVAALNDFHGMFCRAATTEPCPDPNLHLDQRFWSGISPASSRKRRLG